MAESGLEKDFITILDFDVNVENYEEQPLKIEFTDKDGSPRSYTPDFFVRYRRDIVPAKLMKPLLCEIKYRKDLFTNWHILKPKFKAARSLAKGNDWEFKIITEIEIRGAFLENAKFLRPFWMHETNWEHHDILSNLLREMREATPHQLLLAYSEDKWKQAELLSSIWHLLARRMIKTDLNDLLTMNSPLWLMD